MTGPSSETPPEDVLRFDETGRRLSDAEYHAVLDDIINSWPSWDRIVREHEAKVRRGEYLDGTSEASTSPRTLSGTKRQSKRRKAQWLSRG